MPVPRSPALFFFKFETVRTGLTTWLLRRGPWSEAARDWSRGREGLVTTFLHCQKGAPRHTPASAVLCYGWRWPCLLRGGTRVWMGGTRPSASPACRRADRPVRRQALGTESSAIQITPPRRESEECAERFAPRRACGVPTLAAALCWRARASLPRPACAVASRAAVAPAGRAEPRSPLRAASPPHTHMPLGGCSIIRVRVSYLNI